MRRLVAVLVTLALVILGAATPALAVGSADAHPSSTGSRAAVEWRAEAYGPSR